jgi:hypothetical protein
MRDGRQVYKISIVQVIQVIRQIGSVAAPIGHQWRRASSDLALAQSWASKTVCEKMELWRSAETRCHGSQSIMVHGEISTSISNWEITSRQNCTDYSAEIAWTLHGEPFSLRRLQSLHMIVGWSGMIIESQIMLSIVQARQTPDPTEKFAGFGSKHAKTRDRRCDA